MAVLNIVEHDDGAVEVWADVPGADMEGIIVGVGQSRQEAIIDAVRCLEALTEQLQSPPDVWETDKGKYVKGMSRREFTITTHKFAKDV